MLGEKTFAQLSEEEILSTYNEESNSIATIVNHLSGNMLSRWTDFLTTDGEKPWRNRDTEFETRITSKDEFLTTWNKGWECLFDTLKSLSEDDLQKQVYIRNMEHSVVEAINRQLCHYSYHVGQIVFVGKMLKDNKWDSLSIPKGNSMEYNKQKFSQEKTKKHFTDDL